MDSCLKKAMFPLIAGGVTALTAEAQGWRLVIGIHIFVVLKPAICRDSAFDSAFDI